jgi:cytochrome c5
MRYATLLLALSAITLFGCGKSDETSAPVAPPPAEEAPQAESAPMTTPEPAPAAGETAIPGAAPSAPAAPAQTAPAQPAPAAGPAAETAQPDLARGEQTYRRACAFCHDKGVAGAPKIGDTAAWAPRLALGMDALYASSLRGKGAMPAKGGNPALADADVRAAVDYLVAQSR